MNPRRWLSQASSAWQRVAGWFQRNLRARVALGIGLPILLALSALSLVHYWRERHLLEDQARLSAIQFGQVITGSLRHSMLVNDPGMLMAVLDDIGARETIERAQVVDLQGQVVIDSGPNRDGQVQHVVEPGCMACHRLSPETRPDTAVLSTDTDVMRVAVPINNER